VTKKLLTCVLAVVLAPAAAQADTITSLYVFGDSLSDQGNAFILTAGTFPPAPYAERASNGPVAVERLADRLGIPLAPVAAGGTNYAVVGSATGLVNIPGTPIVTDNFAAVQYGQAALENTGIINQLLAFLLTGPVVDPDHALFVVWGGPNDFFLDPSAAGAANAVTNLANSVALLYANGSRRFLVPNMPDLSLTPYGRSLPPAAQAGLQALSAGFNAGLDSALDSLDLFPGIDITRFDTFGLLTSIAADPTAFGFANAEDACLSGNLGGGGSVCVDPSTYVFWDSVHPTAAAHIVLGDAFATAVPEPATVMLFGVGFAAGAARRGRAAHGSSSRPRM
jgi:phospholipase/lecithinase/hemolysin